MNADYLQIKFEEIVNHILQSQPHWSVTVNDSSPWNTSMVAEGVKAYLRLTNQAFDDGYNPDLDSQLIHISGGEMVYNDPDYGSQYFPTICELIAEEIIREG